MSGERPRSDSVDSELESIMVAPVRQETAAANAPQSPMPEQRLPPLPRDAIAVADSIHPLPLGNCDTDTTEDGHRRNVTVMHSLPRIIEEPQSPQLSMTELQPQPQQPLQAQPQSQPQNAAYSTSTSSKESLVITTTNPPPPPPPTTTTAVAVAVAQSTPAETQTLLAQPAATVLATMAISPQTNKRMGLVSVLPEATSLPTAAVANTTAGHDRDEPVQLTRAISASPYAATVDENVNTRVNELLSDLNRKPVQRDEKRLAKLRPPALTSDVKPLPPATKVTPSRTRLKKSMKNAIVGPSCEFVLRCRQNTLC